MTEKDKQDFWEVDTSKVDKDVKKLPVKIQKLAALLFKELEASGPIRKNWDSFGPLTKSKSIPENAYHCHIKKGKPPTYVACWTANKKQKTMRVFYVGTHEKAPY